MALASCPSGWQAFRDEKCFMYIGYNFPYSEAGFSCRGRHSDATLVSVQSHEEEAQLVSMARQHLKGKYNQWVWLGANKTSSQETFSKWVDKSPFRYTNWYDSPGYSCQDMDPNRNCIAMGIFAEKSGATWCNFDCNKNQFHWFCQLAISPKTYSGLENSSLSSGDRLPYGSEHETFDVGNMSLIMFPDLVSGEEGPLRCPYGELVTIHSKTEEDLLIDYLRNNISLTSPVWIGLKRNGSSSNFYWTDGSEVDYVNWARYEPNFGRQNEYCAILDLEARGWRDVPCHEKYHLLCDQYLIEEEDLGIAGWLFYQYFERKEFSLVLWAISVTVLISSTITVFFVYLACKQKVSQMALRMNHETPLYSDIRKQPECECMSNLHDT